MSDILCITGKLRRAALRRSILAAIGHCGRIDLLFTDMVVPGDMAGKKFAESAPARGDLFAIR